MENSSCILIPKIWVHNLIRRYFVLWYMSCVSLPSPPSLCGTSVSKGLSWPRETQRMPLRTNLIRKFVNCGGNVSSGIVLVGYSPWTHPRYIFMLHESYIITLRAQHGSSIISSMPQYSKSCLITARGRLAFYLMLGSRFNDLKLYIESWLPDIFSRSLTACRKRGWRLVNCFKTSI